MRLRSACLILVAGLLWAVPASAATLTPAATISLPGVAGRIDHLAVDLARQRLIVAELGNNTVEIVDLRAGRGLRRLSGFDEPQGVAYLSGPDLIAVANGGDGALDFLKAGDFTRAGRIALGSDADDLRVDRDGGQLFAGFGGGAIAMIDGASRRVRRTLAVPAHPEGFAVDEAAHRIFVNVPERRAIAVLDLATGRAIARWHLPGMLANFPMTLDLARQRVIVATREPPRLVVFDMATGKVTAAIAGCGDADDVFRDARRQRIYQSCGEGFVDVFADDGPAPRRLDRIATAPGARTSLFVPALDRLYVARRAGGHGGAAILVFRPGP